MAPAHATKPAPKPKPKHPHNTKAKPKQKRVQKIGPWVEIPQDRRKPGKLTNTPYVIIQAWTVELQVKVYLGPNGGQISAGYGAYTEITRPRNVPLMSWQGRAAFEMTLDLVFTYAPVRKGQQSIEKDLKLLEDLATRQPGMVVPPSVRLFGPVPHTELRWLVTAIDWGEAVRRHKDGARIRQAATVTLHEYIEDPYITPQRPKGKAAGAKFRWYVIKPHENLKAIAKRMLGNPSKWQQIEALNKGMHGYHLPQPHFKAGDRVKVPSAPKPSGHNAKSQA